MELKERFEKAVADSKELSSKPANTTLLQLYALYKQGTIGDVNIDPPANPFDFVNKAKYDAWAEMKGVSEEEAMEKYIHLIESLK